MKFQRKKVYFICSSNSCALGGQGLFRFAFSTSSVKPYFIALWGDEVTSFQDRYAKYLYICISLTSLVLFFYPGGQCIFIFELSTLFI